MSVVEVCIDSLESARIVKEIMRDTDDYRIELCANLISGGGLTPSIGLFKACAAHIDPGRIMVMIRPRIGSFVYSEEEIEVMKMDILAYKAEGVKGFVFGCLTRSGEVDIGAMRTLVECAAPNDVTCHRAFDITADWERAFNDIVSLRGITRILTSGQATTAVEGIPILSSLIYCAVSGRRVKIVVASGVNATTYPQLHSELGAIEEIHLSASSAIVPAWIQDGFHEDKGETMGFGGRQEWRLDKTKLTNFMEIVRARTSNN